MATIFFAWELGGGLGHVSQLVSLINGLRPAGHRIVVALRELSHAARLFDNSGVKILQSPYKTPGSPPPIATPRTFADVLWNAGFGDASELHVLTEAWGNLLDSAKPDLIVFDHAPTALLAARGRQVKRVVIGNGFCCPPDCSPLPDLRPWMPPEAEQLQEAERHVLDSMNRVLQRRRAEPLERVTQLYGQVDEVFLTTLAEFDHYPGRKTLTPGRGGKSATWSTGCPANPKSVRLFQAATNSKSEIQNSKQEPRSPDPVTSGRGEPNALTPCPSPEYGRGEIRYRGPWSLAGGEPPVWPAGGGKRIYAYLSAFPGLPKVLDALRRTGCPTIVFGGFDARLRDQFASPNIRFETRRLGLKEVAAQCDLAVLSGGQATTLALLLAGKPILQVPLFLEQALNAMATVRVGAGLIAFPRGVDRTGEQIAELLESPQYTDGARTFAAKYAGFSPEAEIARAVRRLSELVNNTQP